MTNRVHADCPDCKCKFILKKCALCKEVLLIHNFGKDKSRRDGLNARCKECHRQFSREWRKRNAAAAG